MKLQIVVNGDTYYVVRGAETLRKFTSGVKATGYIQFLYNMFCEALRRIDELNELIYERPLTLDEMEDYERMVARYERYWQCFEHDY